MDRLTLTERTTPVLGQLVVLVTVISCLRLSAWADPVTPQAITGQTVTALSWLPPAFRYDPALFALLQVLVPVAGLCWLAQVGVPWSSWTFAVGYTALITLHEERRTYIDHTYLLTNQVLLSGALWYHVCRREIRASLRSGTFWSASVCPRWFPVLVAIQIGAFYSWAGIMKLWDSGLGWPNGVTLQLWTHIWGDPESLFTRAILHHQPLAEALQVGTLAAEALALPSLLWRPLRYAVASLLIGFHVGQELVFGWWFGANALLIGLLYFPAEQGLAWLRERIPVAARPMPESRWRRWIVARTDVLGRHYIAAAPSRVTDNHASSGSSPLSVPGEASPEK